MCRRPSRAPLMHSAIRRGGPSNTADLHRDRASAEKTQSRELNEKTTQGQTEVQRSSVGGAGKLGGFAGRQDGSRDQGCVPLPMPLPTQPPALRFAGRGAASAVACTHSPPPFPPAPAPPELGFGLSALRLGRGAGWANWVQSFHRSIHISASVTPRAGLSASPVRPPAAQSRSSAPRWSWRRPTPCPCTC